MATGKRIRTGVALSLTELCAADVRLPGGAPLRIPLDSPENGTWPSLSSALRQVGERLGATDGRLVVALMPPLTEVRRLDLPPLKREQVLQLLSRNAGRYFVTAREPQVVGTSIPKRPTGGARGGPVPVLGAAASARLINAITAAARDAGWTLDGIVPAEVGWSSAAGAIWPTLAKGVAHVVVNHEDRTDLLRMENGALAGVRRFRVGALDAQLIADVMQESRSNGTPPRVGMLGAAGPRQELVRAMPGESAVINTPAGEWTSPGADPMVAAATFVTPDDALTLLTEDLAEIRARAGRRLTAMIVAASAALLIGTVFLELWGLKRELAAVQEERARIRPQLQAMLSGRSTFEASNRKLAALLAAHREAPYLSGVIAEVTDALPEGAHLNSFRARRDTLILDGLARSSGEAFSAIEGIPGLANVKSVGGVQRQLQDDGSALEHFTIQARMLLPAAPATSPFGTAGRPR